MSCTERPGLKGKEVGGIEVLGPREFGGWAGERGVGWGSGSWRGLEAETAAAVFPSCFPVVPFCSFPVVSKP